jgi:hypothetical protein
LEGIFGIIGVFILIIAIYILTVKYPILKNILWAAAFLRISAALIHFFLFTLPDGDLDAIKFEYHIWLFSKLSFVDYFNSFKTSDLALTFTWILSLVYRIFGRNPLIIQSVGVYVGLLSVILLFKISYILSKDLLKSKQSTWFFAVFPTVILYNALILREVYVMYFLLIVILNFVKWYQSKNIYFGFICLLFSLPLYYLHGSNIIITVLIFILFFFSSFNFFINRLKLEKFNLFHSLVIISTPLVTLYLFTVLPGVKIPYLGKFDDIFTFSRILFQTKVTNFGGSVYPDWLSPESPIDFFLLIIPRLGYLLFSPFIWDLRAINHLLGFVDGLLYLFIFYWIAKGILFEKHKQIITRILIILIPLLVVYSWGVGNFGTALRHRVKFIPVFIAISTIYVPKITLTKKSEVPKPNE